MYKALIKSPTLRSTLEDKIKPYMTYMDSFNHISLDLKMEKSENFYKSRIFTGLSI